MPTYYFMPQGSQEWLDVRLGIPTASSFDRIITPAGKPSAQASGYMFDLLAERLTGVVEDAPTVAIMQRGKDLEPHAVEYYKLQTGSDAEPIGFILHDSGFWGASPDRLVGDDGLLEVKCPKAGTHVRYMLEGSVSDAYKPQVQGQLAVSGRKWCDIISYHDQMPMALTRVKRDEQFIAALDAALVKFCEQMRLAWEQLKGMGYVVEEPPRKKAQPDADWLGVTEADALVILEAMKRANA